MKRRRKLLAGVLICTTALGMTACGGTKEEDTSSFDYNADYSSVATGSVNARVAVHDPSIIEEDGTYYIFGSHMAAASTTDLRSWVNIANGYTDKNAVFTDLSADSNPEEFAYTGSRTSLIPTEDGGYHVWAPDVIYNEAQGLYYMYYCTSSTFNASNLCYATSEKIDGPYEWKGALIYSGFNSDTIDGTDVLDYVDLEYAKENYITLGDDYNYKEYPNAIDPTVFYDEDGRMWMVYGSWSGGIFLLEIDESTGEVIHPEADPENNVDPYFGKRLLGGDHKSIEGPYIVYDAEAGYYYLFVSYGSLVTNGGYQIRVFRSETVDGEYVDMGGQYPTAGRNHAYYGLKLSGNYMLPSLRMAYMATGHNSAMIDEDGKRYICYHTRFNDGTEGHSPRVKQYFINEEGWPCMLPYATNGETLPESGYEKDAVVGRYYMINQGMGIDDKIAEPTILYLTEKGNVYGENVTGTWEMTKDTCNVHITMNEVSYSGVFCAMQDEAGTDVMTFSVVGNNESIWGVKYE